MTRTLRFLFTAYLFCGWFFLVEAQAPEYLFSGTVKDSAGNVLPGVSIRIQDTPLGTNSNERGRFVLTSPKTDVVLSFSLLGFAPKSLTVNADHGQNLSITLLQTEKQLHDVLITSEPIQKVNEHIWDYAFYGEYILVLKYKDQSAKSKLVFMDDNMQEVASMDVSKKATGLYRDCMGNTHLVCSDSAYQIYSTFGQVALMPGVDKTRFENYLYRCADTDPTHYYLFEKSGTEKLATVNSNIDTRNLKIRYYMVDKRDKTNKDLITITDEKSLRTRADNERDQRLQSGRGLYVPTMSPEDQEALNQKAPDISTPGPKHKGPLDLKTNPNNIDPTQDPSSAASNNVYGTRPSLAEKLKADENEMNQLFLETILFKEVFAPLFHIDDTTYIFDFLHAKLLRYNVAGDRVSETPIAFGREPGWKPTVLKDRKTGKVYNVFETQKGLEVREIDLQKGICVHTEFIPFHLVENIKVEGGYIYFLYRTDIQSDITYLSRIRIG